MPSTRRRRHLAPAFTAALAGSAILAAPALAAGTQPVDTTILMQCAESPAAATPSPFKVELRIKGTAPASTSPGESGGIADAGTTIRILDDTPANPRVGVYGTIRELRTQASGGASSRSGLGFGSSFREVTKTDGGYGPVAVALSSFLGSFATDRPEAVTVRAETMVLGFRFGPIGSDPFLGDPNPPLDGTECTVAADQPPLAVIPYAARATPRPAVTSLSPNTARVSADFRPSVPTKVTIKGEGFLGESTPTVTFGGGLLGTDVVVIDDHTLTVLTPETWGALSTTSVSVRVDDRTSADTPADDFRFITGLPTITSLSGTVRAGVGGIVRLRGTELKGTKTITVGTRRVRPLLTVSSTELYFVAPALPRGQYGVTATNAVGTSSFNKTITYR